MAQYIQHSSSSESATSTRIFAKLDAKVTWKHKGLRENYSSRGFTDSLSESGLFINLEVLPPVGETVELSLFDGKKEIASVSGQVIRIERDIAKPKVSVLVSGSNKAWKEKVLPAAQAWVTNDLKVNYSDDDWLN